MVKNITKLKYPLPKDFTKRNEDAFKKMMDEWFQYKKQKVSNSQTTNLV